MYPVATLEARQQSLESGKRPYLKASRGVIAITAWLTALMRLKNLGWLSRTTAKAGSIVFHLRDIEGFSTKETAQTLHRSFATVKSRTLRARLQLRDLLDAYFRPMKGKRKL